MKMSKLFQNIPEGQAQPLNFTQSQEKILEQAAQGEIVDAEKFVESFKEDEKKENEDEKGWNGEDGVIPENDNDEKENSYSVGISGKLLLAVIDGFMPAVIIKGAKLAKIKYDKKAEDLKLTETEIELLEGPADAAVNDLLGNLSPTQQFLIALAGIYSGKL